MHRFLLLILVLPAVAWAAPDRAGLIQAWEAAMRKDGALEAQADGGYRYRSESIGYDGGVKIVSAIVRPSDVWDADRGATGTVDFDLGDVPTVRGDAAPTGLATWKAERQSFVYDGAKQSWQPRWIGPGAATAERVAIAMRRYAGYLATALPSDC